MRQAADHPFRCIAAANLPPRTVDERPHCPALLRHMCHLTGVARRKSGWGGKTQQLCWQAFRSALRSQVGRVAAVNQCHCSSREDRNWKGWAC